MGAKLFHGISKESEWRRLLTDVIVTGLVLFFVLVWIEPSPLGRQLEQACYKDTVLSWADSDSVPVQLVDLKNIPLVNGFTPRAPLLALLTSLEQMQPKPAAIGVDIDFSPHETGGWEDTEHDPEFFRECLRLEQVNKVPIYLGIRRSQYLPPSLWLGDEEFGALAASAWVDRGDIGRMPYCLKTRRTPFGPSLNSALASAYLAKKESDDPAAGLPALPGFPPEPGIPKALAWAINRYETVQPEDDRRIRATEFLVDYGPIRSLMEHAQSAVISSPGTATWSRPGFAESCRDRVVLLGDTTWPDDFFALPGFENSVFPGVYMQACACGTLIGRPLLELRWPGRIAVDVLFTAIVVALLAVLRREYRKRQWEINTPRLHNLVTGGVCLLIVLFAGSIARLLHLLWDDYLFVVIGLWLHGVIGDVIEEIGALREAGKRESTA